MTNPVPIKTRQKTYFECCGKEFEFTHLLGSEATFGPWYCEKCGEAYKGMKENGEWMVRSIPEKKSTPGFSLVQIKPQVEPIWIVVPSLKHPNDSDEGRRYYFEEYTCPVNVLNSAEDVALGDHVDPHDLFTFIAFRCGNHDDFRISGLLRGMKDGPAR